MPRERSPLRVLMILDSDYPLRFGGGAESQVRTLALGLRQRGHRVTVLTPRFVNAHRARIQRHEGIPVCRIAYPRIRVLGTLALWLRTAVFLYRHGRRYDTWHVHIAHHLGAISCAIGHRQRKPVVVKISGWWELKKGLLRDDGNWISAVGKHWLQQASAVQAISRRIEIELVRHGFPSRRIVALPNAIDTTRFALRAEPIHGDSPLTAIYVGRLVPEKGLDTLLDAWALAFGTSSSVRLLLVGSGVRDAELRAQAERLGIASQVEFLGHRDDVDILLRRADFGVLPSMIEGLSNTLLEFMASCVPVIASTVSGSEDFIVDDRNGWLFPPGDKTALAARLRQATSLDRRQLFALGRQARVDVEAKASLDSVLERLTALYRGTDPSLIGAATSVAASVSAR